MVTNTVILQTQIGAMTSVSIDLLISIIGIILSVFAGIIAARKDTQSAMDKKADKVEIDKLLEKMEGSNTKSHAEILTQITFIDQRNIREHDILRDEYLREVKNVKETLELIYNTIRRSKS